MKRFLATLISFAVSLSITITLQFSSCSSDNEPDGPAIVGIAPDSGAAGTIVAITGRGFNTDVSKNNVKFNGVVATIQTATETQLTVVAPSGGTTGTIAVSIGTKELNGPVFTYTEPQPTQAYYIRFKANNEVKLYQTVNPGFSACGDCSCGYLPPLDDLNNAGIEICQPSTVTAAMIQALKDKTLSFNSGSPVPNFGMEIDNVSYHTDFVTQVAGSKMTITNVVADGLFAGIKKAYKVTGTFSCRIARSDGSSVLNITEGTFVVRFTEDF
jgi:hypothetical protein